MRREWLPLDKTQHQGTTKTEGENTSVNGVMSKSKENACDYSGSNISAELFSAEPNILSSAASLVTSIISKNIN